MATSGVIEHSIDINRLLTIVETPSYVIPSVLNERHIAVGIITEKAHVSLTVSNDQVQTLIRSDRSSTEYRPIA